MKTQLTKEQSQHLIDLGVPKEKATGWDKKDITYWPTLFTLTDLLEILPGRIFDKTPYQRVIYIDEETGYHVVGYAWTTDSVIVDLELDFLVSFKMKDLIDALYELLRWAIRGKYLKIQ